MNGSDKILLEVAELVSIVIDNELSNEVEVVLWFFKFHSTFDKENCNTSADAEFVINESWPGSCEITRGGFMFNI